MNDLAAGDTQKVLVELSVITPNNDRSRDDGIPHAMDILEKTGLLYERSHNVICLEGEWDEVSNVLHQCYERMQAQSPQGYLQVSIR